tara:strand:+ start:2320 stop:3321 length:1002 start_codon:yes stop_codon:yes gene_type:complete
MIQHSNSIWILTDGKAGTENQCIGLAEAMEMPYTIKRIKLRKYVKFFSANILKSFFIIKKTHLKLLYQNWNILNEPYPAILIAAGKATVAASIAIRKKSNQKTFVVQLLNPRVNPTLFDIVVPHIHDKIYGKNVFPTRGAINRVNNKLLEKELKNFISDFSNIPKPSIAILIGGNSKHYKLDNHVSNEIFRKIKKTQDEYNAGLLVTFSRRTNPELIKKCKEKLQNSNTFIWDNIGENPYYAYLAFADFIVVTEDSISMTSEAASTGKPVYIINLPSNSKKFKNFHLDLNKEGITKPFNGQLDNPWQYKKLDEAQKTAKIVLKKFNSSKFQER